MAAVTALATGLSGCTADPPPPIEQTEPTQTPAPVPQRNTVVVAIDDIGAGFNPHLLADQSPVGNAVAELVLPSAFRPVPNPGNPAIVDRVPDESVLVSAEVTSQNPFTVTYQLRTDAQWSDSAPIAAEDFRYLWQQMITQPGVVDPSGYRLIENIASSGGGKTVTVTLREPYPAWRELFTDLLPAHLVKDTPGGFATGLAESIPVSGGRFSVDSVDRGRGEILLERNDRFWGLPARPDEILLRRGGTDSQLTDSMRTGDVQVAQIHGGSALLAQLGAVPGVRAGTQMQPRTLDLTLNARTPEFADPRVRRGVLGLLDPDLLATVAAGTESAVVPARAQVFAPSDPGYAPSAPPRPTREQALGLLAEAGYLPVAPAVPVDVPDGLPVATTAAAPATTPAPAPETETEGLLVRDGVPLSLVIGVAEDAGVPLAVARTAADVLRGAGIRTTVTALPADELYGEALVEGSVHAVVGWMRAGNDPATAALSRFGCLPVPPAAEDTTPRDTADADPAATPASAAQTTPDAEVIEEDAVIAQLEAPSNLSSVCDPTLTADLDAAVRGTGDAREILTAAQPKLWDLAVNLPILQDRTVVAAGPGIDGVSLAGAVPAGVVADAHDWWRATP